jgi:glycerol-3-phosphate O-acyltransferase
MDKDLTLNDKLKTKGPIELIRKLSQKGTVILVPTHFSNLDSIIMGWTVKTMGLPAFMYGAGLNLYNTRLFASLMGGLGAYKVDRRKKNEIYLETLKMYSRTAIDNGVHCLFFPGGTRSRYGGIEKKIKLGLLSTAVDVQRENCIKNPDSPRKIFILPAVINYHFVLEAPSLISQELEQSGKELYFVENDGVSNTYKLIKFFIKFFTVSSEMTVSYGHPMDIFGNLVNIEGISTDKNGNQIQLKDYFSFNEEIKIDPQRDNRYTQELSESILAQYYKINIVFTSHVLAFVAFEIIRKRYNLGIYDLIKIPEEDILINYDFFKEKVEELKNVIVKMHLNGEVDISERFNWKIDEFINHGIENLGLYNEKRPLIFNKFGNIITQDLSLLYYYRNRLEGYGLEKYI